MSGGHTRYRRGTTVRVVLDDGRDFYDRVGDISHSRKFIFLERTGRLERWRVRRMFQVKGVTEEKLVPHGAP